MPGILFGLALGIVLLLASTKILVSLSEKLSSSLKISPLFVGLTLLAVGTSLPELAVSSIASLKNDPGLALGNIVGSNIVNVLLVLPVGILLGKLRIGTTKTQRNAAILLLVTAVYIVSRFLPLGNVFWGVLFIFLAVILTVVEYLWAVFGSKHEDFVKVNRLKKEKFTPGEYFLLALSAIGIIAGGYFTVSSVENLSVISGYSTVVLGLSLTAIATSLPELLSTIFSQAEHQEKLTIGNLIGSNIYNLLLIGGMVNLFSPVTRPRPADLLILALTALLFFLIIRRYSGQKIPRRISLWLFALFAFYLVYLQSPYAV